MSSPLPAPRPRDPATALNVLRSLRGLGDPVAWAVAISAVKPCSAWALLEGERPSMFDGLSLAEGGLLLGSVLVGPVLARRAVTAAGHREAVATTVGIATRRAATGLTAAAWVAVPIVPGAILCVIGVGATEASGSLGAVTRWVAAGFAAVAVAMPAAAWAVASVVAGDGLSIATRLWSWAVMRPVLLGQSAACGLGCVATVAVTADLAERLAAEAGPLAAAVTITGEAAVAIVFWSAAAWTVLVLRDDEDGVGSDEIVGT